MGDRYFVRSSEDGPEKGPFELDQVQKSFDRGLLKADAKARLEGGEKWIPLKELCAPDLARQGKRAPQDGAHRLDPYEVDRQIAMDHASRGGGGGGANVGIGLAMIVAGVVLTLISTSQAGGGGVIFVGLVVFGIIRVIRGAAS
jgi:hypothetical protein